MDQPTNKIVGNWSGVAFFARTPFATMCGLASMSLFIVSLTQDCFFIDRAENPRAWSNGFGLLAVGWLGIFTGVYAWLANPTLLIAWLAMWSPAHRIYSLGASVVAMLLALSFLLYDNILADEAGNRAMITGYGPGYWIWISSAAFALIGSSSWYIDLSNDLRLRMKHDRAKLVASAVGFVCVIAGAMAGSLLQGILFGLAAAFAVKATIARSRTTHQLATNVPSSPIDPTKPNTSQAKRFRPWLIRLPLVAVLAAGMGWLGLILIFMGTPHFPAFDDFWTRYVFLASILIWTAISFVLSKRKLQDWLVWGFLSPCLGSLIVAPPASIAVVMINAHIVFPVGIATGAMMWLIFNLPRRNLVGQCDFQSPSRIVDANTAPNSIGAATSVSPLRFQHHRI